VRPKQTHLEEHLTLMDQLPLRTLCAFCGWTCEGTAAVCRERALQHRSRRHPEAIHKRRYNRNLKSFRQPKLSEEQTTELNVERFKRARLTGVDLSGETQ
jgi:hypothetical protein